MKPIQGEKEKGNRSLEGLRRPPLKGTNECRVERGERARFIYLFIYFFGEIEMVSGK